MDCLAAIRPVTLRIHDSSVGVAAILRIKNKFQYQATVKVNKNQINKQVKEL